jgi:hypothetical protein
MAAPPRLGWRQGERIAGAVVGMAAERTQIRRRRWGVAARPDSLYESRTSRCRRWNGGAAAVGTAAWRADSRCRGSGVGDPGERAPGLARCLTHFGAAVGIAALPRLERRHRERRFAHPTPGFFLAGTTGLASTKCRYEVPRVTCDLRFWSSWLWTPENFSCPRNPMFISVWLVGGVNRTLIFVCFGFCWGQGGVRFSVPGDYSSLAASCIRASTNSARASVSGSASAYLETKSWLAIPARAYLTIVCSF